MAILKLKNYNNKYEFKEGEFIFKILQKNGINIEVPCGGVGTCGKCKIKLISGNVTPLTDEELEYLSKEELNTNIRLSCLTKAQGDIEVELLNSTENHKILTEGYMPEFKINPVITKKFQKIPENESFEGKTYEEIFKSLEFNLNLENLEILNEFPNVITSGNFTKIYSSDELIGIEAGNNDIIYGIAVDIGTTTVVASLIDISNGKEISSESMINPQKEYGSDVLSRIDFENKNENGLKLLNKAVINCINKLIVDLTLKNNISLKNIYKVSIAANTTMMHFLLNVSAQSIGKYPYSPVFLSGKSISAKDMGINISPFGKIYTLPGVSGYIGADIVAGAVVSELSKTDKNILFIDIGTNGEIIFSKKGELSSCSCAAGPALEGMNISFGMRAADGAIEAVKFTENRVELKVIGEKIPVGICGSGILDSISEIVRTGLVNKTGRLNSLNNLENPYGNLIVEKDGKKCIQLSKNPEILVSQKDIRQVQLAKAAIVSGFLALLDENKITMNDVDEVIIAGQFGKHLTVKSLIGSGIIPKELGEKVRYIGNSSKTGAVMCLLSKDARKEMELIAKKIKYFELSTKENYEKLFIDSLNF